MDAYALHHNLTTLLNWKFMSPLWLKCSHYMDFPMIHMLNTIATRSSNTNLDKNFSVYQIHTSDTIYRSVKRISATGSNSNSMRKCNMC